MLWVVSIIVFIIFSIAVPICVIAGFIKDIIDYICD